MAKILYCKFCVQIVSFYDKKCPNCQRLIEPVKSLRDKTYYEKKSKEKYGIPSFAHRIFMEEEFSKSYHYLNNPLAHTANTKTIAGGAVNIPRCPTCDSTNIIKIGNIKRVAHGYAFGLLSKTARSQFECKNCGYKW